MSCKFHFFSMEFELDLTVDEKEMEAVLKEEQKIEFYYSVGMDCPVDFCNASGFWSKKKYMHHWFECHRETSSSYHCAVKNCQATCSRRTDMRTHIRNKHEKDPHHIENILQKCQVVHCVNSQFVDPGFFYF